MCKGWRYKPSTTHNNHNTHTLRHPMHNTHHTSDKAILPEILRWSITSKRGTIRPVAAILFTVFVSYFLSLFSFNILVQVLSSTPPLSLPYNTHSFQSNKKFTVAVRIFNLGCEYGAWIYLKWKEPDTPRPFEVPGNFPLPYFFPPPANQHDPRRIDWCNCNLRTYVGLFGGVAGLWGLDTLDLHTRSERCSGASLFIALAVAAISWLQVTRCVCERIYSLKAQLLKRECTKYDIGFNPLSFPVQAIL